VLITNQIREKIGIMFGNPETTPGGRALRFFASVRIDLRRIEDIKSKVNGELLGVRTKGRVIKNKMAPPFRIGEFDILYGRGVNTLGCIVDLCETKGVLTKSGAWYRYEGEAIGNGRDQAIAHLASDMEFAELIKKQALAA
jgi:recombination protein RecA